MDELRQRNVYCRRNRDDFHHSTYRRDYRGRGRYYNNYPPHRNYYLHNRRNCRDRNERVAARPASPVEGSEEYLKRKIQNTSALIMRHLLTPEEAFPSNNKKIIQNEDTEIMTPMVLKNHHKRQSKPAAKRVSYTAEEIREKIIGHVTKLNEGRKKNFINMNNSSELDNVLNLINKQKRLEISEFLRRMNPSLNNEDGNVPVVADIGVEFQDLPSDIIEELKKTLGIDLEQFGHDSLEPFHPTPESEFPAITPHVQQESTLQQQNLFPPPEYKSPSTDLQLQSTLEPSLHATSTITKITSVDLNPAVSDIKSEPPDLASDNVEPEPINICDNNEQIPKESQSDPPLVEIKDEPDDLFVESFNTPAIKDEPDSDSEYDKMTVVNDDTHREPSLKFNAVMAIEATINTFIDIDKRESDGHYINYNQLIDKIKGFERCSKLLEDYKKDLMEDLFHSVRKLDEEEGSYYYSDNSQERESGDLLSETVFSESNGVSARKRGGEQEQKSSEEVKKIKLKAIDDEPEVWTNIKEVVCAFTVIYRASKTSNILVMGTESGKVLMVNLETNRIERTLAVFEGPVTGFSIVRKRFLYVGTATKQLNVYSIAKGDLIESQLMSNPILCMSQAHGWIFIGCKNGSIVKFWTRSRGVSQEHTSESRLDILAIIASREGPRKILIVGQRRGPIVIRDAESMLHLRNFYDQQEVVSSTVYAMEFYNGKLYCGTATDDILQFEFHNAQLQHRLKASESKGITCMRLLHNILFAGCSNGSVYAYNTLDTPELLRVLEGPGGSINSLAVLPKHIVISTLARKLAYIEIPSDVLAAISFVTPVKPPKIPDLS
ncbi:uncharacterized protein LOC126733509 [Anthonomus grandis grandis]|uniref:uncharacterized protein LOC126733509 n=1 Tax=Anthonomus grandis grandis TaxID=2921223 RepID=UPI0021665753|nr:uncharacterized protein LOC126733509 [Anthonomus grandis grandis]